MNPKTDKLPATLAEFQAMPQLDLTQPENTCFMFLCALNLYLTDKKAGVAAMNLLRGPRPLVLYDIQFLSDRLSDKAYLPLAYFRGASPENGYKPDIPYELEVLADPTGRPSEEGYMRLFLQTPGADSPRPITLRRKGDSWFLWEYSSILTGIRIPKAEDPWA